MRHNPLTIRPSDRRRPKHGVSRQSQGRHRPRTENGVAPPDDDLPGRRNRYRPVRQLRLHDSSGRTFGRDPRLRGRFLARLLCNGLAGRAVRGHAVRRQLPHVCEAVHRTRHRIHHRHPVLAELGGGARLGVHGGRAVDATMVSSFAVLGVVGRVHCGGVRAQHHVRAAIW